MSRRKTTPAGAALALFIFAGAAGAPVAGPIVHSVVNAGAQAYVSLMLPDR